MTSKTVSVALAVVFSFATLSTGEAKEPKKKGAGRAVTPEQFFARFDRNNDQKLDAEEAAGVRQAFDALKALDTDKDGSLSDSEIAAAKVGVKKAKKTK